MGPFGWLASASDWLQIEDFLERYARARRKQTNSSKNALRLLTLPHKRIATWLGCGLTRASGRRLA